MWYGAGAYLSVRLPILRQHNCIMGRKVNILLFTGVQLQSGLWVENNTVREDGDTPFTVRLTKDGVAEDKHFDDFELRRNQPRRPRNR